MRFIPGSATRCLRWLGRALSVLVVAMVALIVIGQHQFDLPRMMTFEAALFMFFFGSWLGLIVSWRWELLGAAMTFGGMGLFYLVHYLSTSKWPRGWAFAMIASPAVLFLCCGLSDWWRRLSLASRADRRAMPREL